MVLAAFLTAGMIFGYGSALFGTCHKGDGGWDRPCHRSAQLEAPR